MALLLWHDLISYVSTLQPMAIACDSTGLKLVVTSFQSGYDNFLSPDGGLTWQACPGTPSGGDEFPSVSSSDGQFLLTATGSTGANVLSRSTDSGASWSNITTSVNNINCLGMSDDGQNILIGDVSTGRGGSGTAYYSTNGGTSWTQVTGGSLPADATWTAARVSKDGSTWYFGVIQATTGTAQFVIKSTNSGSSWTDVTPTPGFVTAYLGIACSSDGTTVTALAAGATNPDPATPWVSTNSGGSWTSKGTVGTRGGYGQLSCSDDGTILLLCDGNADVWYSIDTATSWTHQKTVANVDLIALFGCLSSDGTKGACGGNFRGFYSTEAPPPSLGLTWYDHTDVDPTSGDFNFVVADSTGLSIAAGSEHPPDNTYTSEDNALTWTSRGENGIGFFGASSSDGQVIAAMQFAGGSVAYTTNRGSTWNLSADSGTLQVQTFSMSGDGMKMLAGDTSSAPGTQKAFFTTDQGVTWTQLTGSPSTTDLANWNASCISRDGSHWYVGALLGTTVTSFVARSTNNGSTWTDITPLGPSGIHPDLNSLCCSADGQFVFVLDSNGFNMYSSTNAGGSWTNLGPPPGANDTEMVVCSDDGSVIVFVGQDASVWVSKTSGASWSKQADVNGNFLDAFWADIGADGTQAAATGDGFMYSTAPSSPSGAMFAMLRGMAKARASPSGAILPVSISARATGMFKSREILMLPKAPLRSTIKGMAAVAPSPSGLGHLFGRIAGMAAAAFAASTAGTLPFARLKGMAAARPVLSGRALTAARLKGAVKARSRPGGAFFLFARVKGALKEKALLAPRTRLAGRLAGMAKAAVQPSGRLAFLLARFGGQAKARVRVPQGTLISLAGFLKGMAQARVNLRRGLVARIKGIVTIRDAFLTTQPFSDPEVFYGRAERGMYTGRDDCGDCCEDEDGWDWV